MCPPNPEDKKPPQCRVSTCKRPQIGKGVCDEHWFRDSPMSAIREAIWDNRDRLKADGLKPPMTKQNPQHVHRFRIIPQGEYETCAVCMTESKRLTRLRDN